MSWYIGQKIICVQKNIDNRHLPLIVGNIYTIRGIRVWVPVRGYSGIRLMEIVNRLSRTTGEELAYREVRFKPLDEQEVDISIFTDILKGIEAGEKEYA